MTAQFKVTRDCLFKYIFGSQKNTDIDISFANAVLDDSVYFDLPPVRFFRDGFISFNLQYVLLDNKLNHA